MRVLTSASQCLPVLVAPSGGDPEARTLSRMRVAAVEHVSSSRSQWCQAPNRAGAGAGG
eukprot:COSAG01_NODE_4068_length_5383_cov_7.524981_11_plen_59_part_00